MKPAGARLVGLLLELLCGVGTVACGDEAPEVCDSSSEVRGAVQLEGGGQQPTGDALPTQCGHAYVFVTGECQYFAYGRTD